MTLTYSEAARQIENERQEAIFEDFPEFRGKEEDAAVISGRVAAGFYDPVALAIPWTRIAQAGRLATIAAGGTFSAGDAALREYSLYGTVSPLNVGLAAGIGSAATGVSAVIADKVNKAIPGGKLITVDETGKPVITNMSRIDVEDTLGDLSPEVKKGLELVSNDVYKVSGPYIARFSKDLESLGVKYNKRLIARNELKKHQKQLEQLERIGLDKQGELFKGGQVEQVKKIIAAQKKLIEKYQKEIDDILLKQMPEDLGVVGFESFKKAYQAGLLKGKVGEQLTRAFVQEAVRPLIGAVGGFAAGSAMGADDNSAYMSAAIGAGITMGIISKRLELDKGIPKEVVSFFKKEGEKVFKRNWRTNLNLTLFGAGTHAAYMQSRSSVLRDFSEDLYGYRGNAYDLGKPMRQNIEELRYTSNDYFRKQVFDLLQDVDDDTILTAGRIIQQQDAPSNMKYNFIEKGDLDNKQAVELANKFIGIRKEIKDYAEKAGLTFTELDSYGLTQILDSTAVKNMGFANAQKIIAQAFIIQSKNLSVKDSKVKVLTKKEANRLAIKFLNHSDNVRRQEVLGEISITDDTFKLINNDGKKIKKGESLLQASKYLANERTLVDPEARAFAKSLFIQDPEFTTLRLAENVVPVAEFARRFGEKGQGLRKVFADIKKYYSQFGNVDTNASLQKLVKEDFKQVRNSVNAYFGVYDLQRGGVRGSDAFKSVVLTLQTLLSTTKLTKVALPSLGDLLQVIQNSGFRAAANSALLQIKQRGSKAIKPSAALAQRSPTDETGKIFKEPIFGRTFGSRKYRNTLERELSDFSQTATTNYQKGLINFQGRFFEIVQLGRVTRFAREFAYDAGAFRMFDLGKKAATGNLSKAQIREINLLGFKPEEIKFLGKFKSMDDAFKNAEGKIVIDIAGRRSADRDALIPQIGNRRLFSQSRDPFMKFAGSFLSWAQAKATQTNSLVRRIEDGDAKLALMMLASLPIYGAVRSLQISMNSSEEFREEHPNFLSGFENEGDLRKFIADSLIFSGQTLPFSIDKLVNFMKYSNSDITESIYPVLGFLNDLSAPIRTGIKGKPFTGATRFVETVVPFGKDITRSEKVGEALGLPDTIEGEAKFRDSDRALRLNFVTGGEVEGEEVPFTQENPADRINPYTGEPYSKTSKGVLATLKARQEDRIPKTYGGLLNNLQRRKKFALGATVAGLLTREILDQLPNKVYRGGSSRIITSKEGTSSVFATPDKIMADSFADPKSVAKSMVTDGESLKMKDKLNLHEIDISGAKNPYVLDQPSEAMKIRIERALMKEGNSDDRNEALMSLLNPEDFDIRVASSDFYRVNREVGKFLKDEGYDIALDSKTLQKGFNNNPEAELFILDSFPVKAIPRLKVKGQEIEGGDLVTFKDVAKKVDEPPTNLNKKTKELKDEIIVENVPAYQKFDITETDLNKWRKETKVLVDKKAEDTGLPQKRKQVPEIVQAATDLSTNKISVDEYKKVVDKLMPIVPFKQVPELTPVIDVVRSLKYNQVNPTNKDVYRGIVGADIDSIPIDTKVALRLDIPAYDNFDKWVVSIHDGTKRLGKVYGYSNTGWIKDVNFSTDSKFAFNIARGFSEKGKRVDKATIARAFGLWKDHTPEEAFKKAQQYMDDPEWSQIGMNPYRFSYFYDKADGMPVVTADELIQIGPLVLAKNVTKTKPTDEMFKVTLDSGRTFTFSTGGNVETPTEPEEFLIYKLLQDDEERLGFFEGTEVDNSLRLDGTKKSQIGHKGRIKNNISGKIMTELSAGKPDTEEGFYPLINPYTTDKQIEFIQNFDFEKNNIFETKVGRQMNRNAKKYYRESLEKGVSPFVNDK